MTCGEDASICIWGKKGDMTEKTTGVERKRREKDSRKKVYQSI